jgi:excinuclease ABC subunit C
LIVIDGGKGQVSSALMTIVERKKQIPLIGLAKREETIVIPQKQFSKIEFLEIKLPKDTGGINLLRRIRDEAHRFAITYHRLLRKKRMSEEFK